MELGDILSPIASLILGFIGALFGVRQANAVWQREQNEKRTLALRNYQRALYDMAMYLEGVEIPELRGHPKPEDIDLTRRAAFPYFAEVDKPDYYKLMAPNPGPYTSAMEDSNNYAAASAVIKRMLEDERSPTTNKMKLRIQRLVSRFIRRTNRPTAVTDSATEH